MWNEIPIKAWTKYFLYTSYVVPSIYRMEYTRANKTNNSNSTRRKSFIRTDDCSSLLVSHWSYVIFYRSHFGFVAESRWLNSLRLLQQKKNFSNDKFVACKPFLSYFCVCANGYSIDTINRRYGWLCCFLPMQWQYARDLNRVQSALKRVQFHIT